MSAGAYGGVPLEILVPIPVSGMGLSHGAVEQDGDHIGPGTVSAGLGEHQPYCDTIQHYVNRL